MHNFEDIPLLQSHPLVLGSRHDFAVAFYGDRTLAQSEVLEQLPDGQIGRQLLGGAVDGHAHLDGYRACRS